MDFDTYKKYELPKVTIFTTFQKILDCAPGSNFTIPTIHSLVVNSQDTFNAKHMISRSSTDRHYNRPIKLLRLNKNKNKNEIFTIYEDDLSTCTYLDIQNLWHICPKNIDCLKCKNFTFNPDKVIQYIEEARAFVPDLLGAFLYHNLVKSLYVEKKNFPSLLVFYQVFHKQNLNGILSITRHTIDELKDLVTTCTFESIEKKLENNLNKKDTLLESTSRDLFGLPPYHSTNSFDLIFCKDEFSCKTSVRSPSNVSSNDEHILSICPIDNGLSSNRRFRICKGKYTRLYSNGINKDGSRISIFPRCPSGNKHNPSTHRIECGDTTKNCRPYDERGLWLDKLFTKNTSFCNELDISLSYISPNIFKKYYPLLIHSPIKSAHLKMVHKNSKYIQRLRQKMTILDFKKMILKNNTNRQFKKIMVPDYRESKYIFNKTFNLHCVVCKLKNKHLKRRKSWICKNCKTKYISTIKKNVNENKLLNLFNEEIQLTNPEGYWLIVPSPIRYANAPRIMYDAANRLIKDIKETNPKPRDTCLTTKELANLKKKILNKSTKSKSPAKWYIYPQNVPIIYGAANDELKGGKDNVFRKKIMTKRCINSCRLTMTLDADLKGSEISIPRTIWKNIGYPDYVIAIRYPSISNLNMTIHKVIVHDTYGCHLAMTARAPPTICKGHNLDFDGDAMTFMALDKESEYELRLLISPEYNISTNGELRLTFSKDAAIGLGFCSDGLTPLHKVISEDLANDYFAGRATSLETFKKFTEYENIGRNQARKIIYTGNKDAILEYIGTEAGKLNNAHYIKMFVGDNCLKNGLSKNEFIETSKETRKALLDTPANASDDGCVFSLALYVLKDSILQYDYSITTQNKEIISFYGFEMHPKYGFKDICFDIPWTEEELKLDENFRPVGLDIKLEKIDLNFENINIHVQNILSSDNMRLYKVITDKPIKVYGRLKYSSLMQALKLDRENIYVVKFHVYKDYYCSYVFKFK